MLASVAETSVSAGELWLRFLGMFGLFAPFVLWGCHSSKKEAVEKAARRRESLSLPAKRPLSSV